MYLVTSFTRHAPTELYCLIYYHQTLSNRQKMKFRSKLLCAARPLSKDRRSGNTFPFSSKSSSTLSLEIRRLGRSLDEYLVCRSFSTVFFSQTFRDSRCFFFCTFLLRNLISFGFKSKNNSPSDESKKKWRNVKTWSLLSPVFSYKLII